jgi:hypothetical protein
MLASLNRTSFIRTRKTDGTSVEVAWSTLCSRRDVVTTISGEDVVMRREQGPRSRCFVGKAVLEHRFFDKLGPGDAAVLEALRREIWRRSLFYNHMTAREVRQALPELWATALKFTLERSPRKSSVPGLVAPGIADGRPRHAD